MYHESTPRDIFEIQTVNNVAENFSFNFRIYKIFSYLLSFANFIPPNLCLPLRPSQILNIFHVSISYWKVLLVLIKNKSTMHRTWVLDLLSKPV